MGTQAQFLPDTTKPSQLANARIILMQDDLSVAVEPTGSIGRVPINPAPTSPGALGIDVAVTGLMNLVIAGAEQAIQSSRAANADRESVALRGHGIGASFRNDLKSSFSNAIATSPWLKAASVEITQQKNPTLNTEHQSLLQLTVVYHLSPDASSLIVQGRLIYIKQGETKPDYGRFYTYFSAPVGSERDESAIAKWVLSDQALLRARLSEGLHELITMVNLDFLNPVTRPASVSTIAGYNPFTGNQDQWHGSILLDEKPRVIIRIANGNLLSVVT
jgi:hypothetical protein